MKHSLGIVWFGLLLVIVTGCSDLKKKDKNKISRNQAERSDAGIKDSQSWSAYISSSDVDTTIKILLKSQEALTLMNQWDSATKISLKLIKYASEKNDTLTCARSLILLNEVQDKTINNKIKPFLSEAIQSCNGAGWKKESIILQTRLASILSNIGSSDSAYSLYFQSLKDAEKMNTKELLVPIYGGLANNFDYNSDTTQSEYYYRKGLKVAIESNDSVQLSRIYHDFASFNYDYQRDSVLFFYEQSLRYLTPKTSPLQRIKIDYNMALVYFDQQQYERAGLYFTNMLDQCVKSGYKEGEAVAYKALGFLHRETGNLKTGIAELKKSVQIADSLQDNYLKLQSLYELQWTQEADKSFYDALQTSNTIREITNLILSDEKKVELNKLEIAYQTEKKEIENKLLKKNLNIRSYFLAGSVILSVLLLIVIYLVRRNNVLLSAKTRSDFRIMQQYRNELQKKQNQIDKTAEIQNAENEDIEASWIKILQFIESASPFLNPKIKAEEFAESIGIPYRKLSAIINQKKGINFAGLMNEFRVKKARQLLEDETLSHLKTEALGEMSGFGTRQSFTSAFEKQTGVTPGFYREQIRKQS